VFKIAFEPTKEVGCNGFMFEIFFEAMFSLIQISSSGLKPKSFLTLSISGKGSNTLIKNTLGYILTKPSTVSLEFSAKYALKTEFTDAAPFDLKLETIANTFVCYRIFDCIF